MISHLIRSSLVSVAIPVWMALNLFSVQAQSPLGALHGVTANPDGTVIPSAVVVVHRPGDSTDLTTISGFDGAFSVLNLKPGRYEVKAKQKGIAQPHGHRRCRRKTGSEGRSSAGREHAGASRCRPQPSRSEEV